MTDATDLERLDDDGLLAEEEASPVPRPEGYLRPPKGVREAVLAHYGGVCAWCGSADRPELDHTANDGAAHRRQLRAANLSLEEWLRDYGYPRGYVRVLCRPCHELKTWGVVRARTALHRFVYCITHTREGHRLMPPRKGATPVHLTLSAEALAQLERLAEQAPDQNKSLVVQGLLLRTITDHTGAYNGHFADILTSVEQRLTVIPDTVATHLTQLTATAQTVTGYFHDRRDLMTHMDASLAEIGAVLRRAFPPEAELAERRARAPQLSRWRRVLIQLLGGSV